MERAEEGPSPADVRINVNSPPFHRGGVRVRSGRPAADSDGYDEGYGRHF